MTVEVVIEDDRWSAAGIDALAVRAVGAALSHLGLAEDWEVVVLAAGDARVAALNADFRGKAQPTNILSWPSAERAAGAPGSAPRPPDPEEGPELGDIALAFETCVREAAEAGVSFEHHVVHLVVHGTLHLLGYDHEHDADGDLMERTEVEILASLGVPDPY